MENQKKDLLSEVAETIKNHPIKSLIAYDILTPEERKKEINEGIVRYLVVFGLLGLLFGPKYFDPIARFLYENDFFGKIETEEDIEKKLKPQLEGLKILLWVTTIVTWSFVVVCIYLSARQSSDYQ